MTRHCPDYSRTRNRTGSRSAPERRMGGAPPTGAHRYCPLGESTRVRWGAYRQWGSEAVLRSAANRGPWVLSSESPENEARRVLVSGDRQPHVVIRVVGESFEDGRVELSRPSNHRTDSAVLILCEALQDLVRDRLVLRHPEPHIRVSRHDIQPDVRGCLLVRGTVVVAWVLTRAQTNELLRVAQHASRLRGPFPAPGCPRTLPASSRSRSRCDRRLGDTRARAVWTRGRT